MVSIDPPLKKIRYLFWILAIAGLALILFVALWHRQLYSEDCYGEARFTIKKFGKIKEKKLKESSGLAHYKGNAFFTQNDDTDSSLYLISAKGKLLQKWTLPYKNRDWEDVCTNGQGKIFVGDFGNNGNKSRALRIYIFNPEKNKTEGVIRFRYEEQEDFPPIHPGKMNFDCEAFVFWKDSLYLFTKNKSERSTCIYSIPAKPGNYTLRKKQELPILGTVTAAALRGDGKELTLLTYGKVYFYSLTNGLQNIPQWDHCLAWWKLRQSESISYWGKDSLLAGNEQRDLFLITRK